MTRAEQQRIARIARGRGEEGLRLLEGPKAVRDALASGHVVQVWIDEGLDTDLGAMAHEAGVPVAFGARRDFDRLGRTVTPQGVLAVVRDVARPLEAVVARAGFLLWIDGVQDPGNLGALVRVAAAFGLDGILVGHGSADPQGLKAFRASAGLALTVPFARADADEIARALGERGVEVWALDAGGEDLFALRDAPARLALAVGAEGPGVGAQARAASTKRIGVPLSDGVDSLNVAVAAGIAVSQLARSRS